MLYNSYDVVLIYALLSENEIMTSNKRIKTNQSDEIMHSIEDGISVFKWQGICNLNL